VPWDWRIWVLETKPITIPAIDPMPARLRMDRIRLAMASPFVLGAEAGYA
jgi:hypothetical protein